MKNEKIKELLERYVDQVYPSKKEFLDYLEKGDKIKIYIGVDPTGPDLHLGHTTNFLLLKKFQNLGHEIIILVGDFTAMIGDPTDKLAERVPLTREETLKNAKTYKEQVAKILDFSGKNPAKMLFNSKWLDKLTYKEIIQLASHFTVQQMLKRDMFDKRIAAGKPISLHEFLYPISVGYDCVHLDVDVEMGGSDQTFNMLIGRDMMRDLRDKEKFVITTPLLINPKTDKKIMSKSEGGYVAVNDGSGEMFGKIMALPDEILTVMFEMCTEIPVKEIKKIEADLKKGANPRDIKMRLAREIVIMYHSEKEAEKAETDFVNQFSKRELPEKIKEFKFSGGDWKLADIISDMGLTDSKTEARRLIEQNAVKVDGTVISDREAIIGLQTGMVIQVGKRRFGKIKVTK